MSLYFVLLTNRKFTSTCGIGGNLIDLACWRVRSGDNATQGILYHVEPRPMVRPRRTWLAWTLEDEYRRAKVRGETRIPAGRYRVTLRTEGGMAPRYAARFGADWHRGMLWVRDVPGFDFIYLHVLNREDQTDGCLGVGDGFAGWELVGSEAAYRRVYSLLRGPLLRGEEVWIEYVDVDTPTNLPGGAA